MRLYLSSYQWGNQPEKLFNLVGSGSRRVALVTNAAYQFAEEGIIERLEQDTQYLKTAGFVPERLDLRNYFNKDPAELATLLKNFGLIWVRGANVFVLRRAMRQSGFDSIILEMLKNDSVVYGGFSAGACVMGTTLRGLDIVDDAYVVPQGYDSAVIWGGLSVLPYVFVPHFKSNHPETELVDKAVAYFEKNNVAYKALSDGEALLIDGQKQSIIG